MVFTGDLGGLLAGGGAAQREDPVPRAERLFFRESSGKERGGL